MQKKKKDIIYHIVLYVLWVMSPTRQPNPQSPLEEKNIVPSARSSTVMRMRENDEKNCATCLVIVHDGRLDPFRGKRVAEDAVVGTLFHGVDDGGRSFQVHVGDPQRNDVPATVMVPFQRA